MNTSDASLEEAKQNIRRTLLKKRSALPRELKLEKSALICERLISYIKKHFDLNMLHHLSVGAYSPLKHEVQLNAFFTYAYDNGFHLCFPCMNTEYIDGLPFTMRNVSRENIRRETAPFVTNPIAIFDPHDTCLADFEVVQPCNIDILIVPLVGFDQHRKRLGYGGGNYDRFIEQISPECLVIGVAFDEQFYENIPCDEHDMTLPVIIHA